MSIWIFFRLIGALALLMFGMKTMSDSLQKMAGPQLRHVLGTMTTILLDNHNYIPTTDNRLLRRIIRDYKYRGVSAQETIRRWPSVRAGENKWIFPIPGECRCHAEYGDAL